MHSVRRGRTSYFQFHETCSKRSCNFYSPEGTGPCVFRLHGRLLSVLLIYRCPFLWDEMRVLWLSSCHSIQEGELVNRNRKEWNVV
jgi:hypothetical protein